MTRDDLAVVYEMTKAEYHAAARQALADLELTYAQLAEQAASHRFDNDSACQVWLILGGSLPIDFV